MLRRKLLLNLGPLVGLLAITVIAAIVLLQSLLGDLNHLNTEAWQVVEDVNALSTNVNAIEIDLHEIQAGSQRRLDGVIEAVESARVLVDRLGDRYVCRQPGADQLYRSIRDRLPDFEQHVGSLATAEDPGIRHAQSKAALESAVGLRRDTLPLSRYVRDHARAEQEGLLSWFRWVVLGLAIAFLIVINVSVMMLFRMAIMILRPMDQLIAATHSLGQGQFDKRLNLTQRDEFGQLAAAFDDLAEKLATNEQRKMEMLGQVALALNHELNNCIAIIELQLRMLSRPTSSRLPDMEKRLQQIHASLERMTSAVQALKNVRRIVLTDYIPGMKMLDLERSVQIEEPDEPVALDADRENNRAGTT